MSDQFIKAVAFAADKHKNQRRKDVEASPYINHPIALANVLANEGGIANKDVLCAAVLHDILEDIPTTKEEFKALEEDMRRQFGDAITDIVKEVTDDKDLDKDLRKQLQIEHASHSSIEAKMVKLADKICNLRDILSSPPATWSLDRKQAYFKWAADVVAGIRGTNIKLERIFDGLIEQSKELNGPL
jgi:guanosine-3',5'-bis(diphosphate) 3'-pyrophosphohydrolase